MAKVNLKALSLTEDINLENSNDGIENGKILDMRYKEQGKVYRLEYGDAFGMIDGRYFEVDGVDTLYEINPIKSYGDERVRTGFSYSVKEHIEEYSKN